MQFMNFESTELIILQRSQLIVHPAAREAFNLDLLIESEIDGRFISDTYKMLATTGVFLVVAALNDDKDLGRYGYLKNWHVLDNSKNAEISCLCLTLDIDDLVIAKIAAAYVSERFSRMPRISTALADCVEFTKKSPNFLASSDSSKLRKNASAETAVAKACRSSKSTVRSQIRSKRSRILRQMEQIQILYEEIMS